MPHNAMSDEALQRIRDKIRAKIEERGWAVMSVFPDGATPGYSYTIGLTAMSLPEILVMGPSPDVANQLLDACVGSLISGVVHIGQHSPVPLATTTIPFALRLDDEDGTMAALMLSDLDIEQGLKRTAVQLVVPDAAGLFPWQAGCDPRYIQSQEPAILAIEPAPGPSGHGPAIN